MLNKLYYHTINDNIIEYLIPINCNNNNNSKSLNVAI